MGFFFAVLYFLLIAVTTLAVNISFVHTNENYCSKTIFQEEQEHCEAVHVKLPHAQISTLGEHLLSFDNNPLVRKMYLSVHLHDQSADTTDIDGILDQFLAPRPWWIVLSEDTIVHDVSTHEFAVHIFLIRMMPRLELGLHQIAAIQFPPNTQSCQELPLCIVRMVERGWGSQNMLIEGTWGGNPWNVFRIYDTRIGTTNELNLYPTAKFCSDKENLRECVFLPMSNCSVPAEFLQISCTNYNGECRSSSFMHYASATSDGISYGQSSVPADKYNTPYINQIKSQYGDHGSNFKFLRSDKFIDARYLEIKGENWIVRPDTMNTLTSQGFLLRPSAPLRRIVMAVVNQVRKENNFPLGTPCVSMHIRRGDRAYKGDIVEFCRPWRRFDSNGSCYNVDDPKQPCSMSAYDYGCFSQHPYSTLTLVDYLLRAKALQSSKVALVMTDDASWLDQQKASLPSEWADWKIIGMGAKFDHHSSQQQSHVNYDYNAAGEFIATLTLGRQCQSFVGHFGSGLTVSFMHAFCFQHGLTTGHCPNMFDIGYAYNPVSGNQEWQPPMTIPRDA